MLETRICVDLCGGGARERGGHHASVMRFALEGGIFLSEELPMKYKVLLTKSEEGYSASVPGLPGCWSQGATGEDALDNIRAAARDYLSVVDEQLQGGDVREIEVSL